MAYDKIVDSGKLNTGLNDTADAIGAILAELCQYAKPSLAWCIEQQNIGGDPTDPTYLGVGAGFAKEILEYLLLHPPVTGSGLTLRRGSVTPAQNADTLSVTPAANQKPFFILLWKSAGSNGSYPVYFSAYIKMPVTPPGSSQPQWAQDGPYCIVQSENGFYGLYNSNVSDGVAASGAVTFGVKTGTRRYYAGDTYQWVAVYGEVYS